uniref:Uncharacterized protein n=1 Tax=Panagrolaimus sp. PS1159 TaxID=55785 RepID=A0AC35FHK3_9BILA
MPSQFGEYSGQQNFQTFQNESEEGPSAKRQRLDSTTPFEQHHQQKQHFFNSEDDNNSRHSFFEHQKQQLQHPISRSETPTFHETPNSSSAASSRPESSLSGHLKRALR